MSTMSRQAPNFQPTERITPTSVNPSARCSPMEPALAESPIHREQLAHAHRFRLHGQLGQQLAAHAHAPGSVGHINRIFRREAVRRAGLEPVGIGKAQHLAVFLGHQPGQVAAQHVCAACSHISFGRRVYLKSACAVKNVVAINGSNGGQVCVGARADDGHTRGLWI